MDKGYYRYVCYRTNNKENVAIHNKNGQGLLQPCVKISTFNTGSNVAIHNKNGQGLLPLEALYVA